MTFYLVDKEKNITSNKMLQQLKREKNIVKAGFSGVLDPFATGLLIVATNGDTKFIERFLKSDKTYIGEILFGKETDTLDIDGDVIKDVEVDIDIKNLREIIDKKFTGKINQVPPKFSNIKVNGKRAHSLSRNNVPFELKSVDREVKSFEIINFANNVLEFKIIVSSGTYIRSIARDIGVCLNSPSMLISLRRIAIGKIILPNKKISEITRDKIIDINRIDISKDEMKDLLDGKIININYTENGYIAYCEDYVLWIQKIEENKYKIRKRIE